MATAFRLIFLLLPFTLQGFDFFPWFGQDFTLEITPHYNFRYFSKVATDHPLFRDHETGNIIGTEVTITALREYTIGVFASLAQTSKMELGLNGVDFMAGYQFSNDRLGDQFTTAAFFIANGNGSRATRDLILYHSARWELEGHFAIGKEIPCVASWSERGWLDLGVGFGTSGFPYIKGLLFFEKNYSDCFLLGIFAKTWIGFGARALKDHFYGYGSIRHRNLDIGVRYAYFTNYWGCFGGDLSLGVMACNYPRLPIEARIFWTFNVGP